MGILGVFIGWGRWLEIRLPGPERAQLDGGARAGAGPALVPGWARRLPGLVWSVSMALVGAILLFYRES
jgi:hypothetical protein